MTVQTLTLDPVVASAKVIDLDGSAPIERHALPGYYRPYGGGLRVYRYICHPDVPRRPTEVLIEGPKDTGKSRSVLEAINAACARYSGIRVLIARKTRASLSESIMVTLEEKVFSPAQRAHFRVGTRQRTARSSYQYPNGSTIVLAGLDEPTRLQSGEYDIVYIPEATEAGVTERDVEMVSGLLRNSRLPWQLLVMDANPSFPAHWLNQRCNRGATERVLSRHTDNPSITPARLARLDALTGVRRRRLRDGLWAAAEGMVYDGWDPDRHLVARFTPPADWRRRWAVDFGFTNPFTWQGWVEDPDGRLYLYREIYHTRRIVSEHAKRILIATEGDPAPADIVCDHDAEDRATLERALADGVWVRGPVGGAEECAPGDEGARHLRLTKRTTAAFKAVRPGIEAVQERLKVAGDGKPRLMMMAGALLERDRSLDDPDSDDPPRPACLVEEVSSYVWDEGKDRPVKDADHGVDAARYLVARVDRIDKGPRRAGGLKLSPAWAGR